MNDCDDGEGKADPCGEILQKMASGVRAVGVKGSFMSGFATGWPNA